MQQAAAPPDDVSEASYEADFVLWSERQARLLREGRLGELDIVHLVEEVEGVGNSYRDEIESRLAVLLAHLLKWKYQPGSRTRSWEATLLEQRRRIARVIRRAPSLRAYPQEVFADSYLSGRLDAAKETGMDFTLFPPDPPFSLAEALDLDFFPVEPDREARR
ncbi:DUF29 domain-containing protein [Lichenibacterium dinghuense]|uniref:DUF29 domain-containing protein n=1 Tax=Lichenibacterium dinghuense TaxID=2895977 RepID=UPI001F39D3A6|nr:DUF29 domain-containing protein [Lichenibacterium sp. 6Y81]